MLQPKIGDTVTFKAIVEKVFSLDNGEPGSVQVRFVDCAQTGQYVGNLQCGRIHAIEARLPQVGDNVWFDKPDGCPYSGATLIHIHQGPGDNRKWGVVAFLGDIPRSVYYSELRLER